MIEPGPGLLAIGAPGCLLIGAWAGVSGYSGWPLVVPLFFVVAGLPLFPSLAASMLIDWGSAAGASTVYWREPRFVPGRALGYALLALPLTLAGAWLAFRLLERFTDLLRSSAGWIAILLGTLLALRAWRRGELPEVVSQDSAPGSAFAVPPVDASRFRSGIAWAVVAASGFLMGAIGMSGGFNVAVVMLVALSQPARQSVATGLAFTLLALPVAILAYAFKGFVSTALLVTTLPLAGLAALGGLLSARFASRMPERGLGLTLGVCVASAGAVAAVQDWWIGP